MFAYYAEKAPLFIITLKGSDDKLQLWKNGNNVQFVNEDDGSVGEKYIEQHWNLFKDVIKRINKLEFFPDKHKTPELCKIACEQDGMALVFVPNELKTLELCEMSCKKDGAAMGFVPSTLMAPDFLKTLVNYKAELLYYIPEKYRTPELCNLACKQNGMTLHFIQKEHRTLELCMLAVQQNNKALEYVPEEIRSHESMKELISEIEELPKVSKPDVEHMIPLDLYDREISAMRIIAG